METVTGHSNEIQKKEDKIQTQEKRAALQLRYTSS
jgi:hypothetical protein